MNDIFDQALRFIRTLREDSDLKETVLLTYHRNKHRDHEETRGVKVFAVH
jgi:hypothetical protein